MSLSRIIVLCEHDRGVPCDGSAWNNIKLTESFYVHQTCNVDKDPEQNTDLASHAPSSDTAAIQSSASVGKTIRWWLL